MLREHSGWSGLLLDGSHSNSSINLHRTVVDVETIISTFEMHSVPKDLGLLSVDIDSYE